MSNLATLRPKPGDVVEGVYHVECELGSDAFSMVLGTVVPATGKRYAIRYFLTADGQAVAASLQHFVRVANNVKLFDNPGIVETYGIGQHAGVYYAVTEWLEGTTLARFIERNGSIPARDAVALMQPCLEGLAAAHAASIVHGDIRPASVFLCRPTRFEPERARLHKFSAARWADRALVMRKRASHDVDVMQYVSPEELQGQPPDERSDVYAMGVLLYVMIAGRSPFSSVDVKHLAAEVVAGSFTPLSARVNGVPQEIDRAISRALSADPMQRPSNCTELLTQLSGQQAARSGSELARVDGEPRAYTWIRDASEDLSPSLFDLAPVLAEDKVSGHEARVSLTLRVCAVISCLLMAGVFVLRTYEQDNPGPRATAKKRAGVVQAAREGAALSATNAMPVVDVQAPRGQRNDAPGPLPAKPSSDGRPVVRGASAAAPSVAEAPRAAALTPAASSRQAAPSAGPAPSHAVQPPPVQPSPAPRPALREEAALRGRSEALDSMRLE